MLLNLKRVKLNVRVNLTSSNKILGIKIFHLNPPPFFFSAVITEPTDYVLGACWSTAMNYAHLHMRECSPTLYGRGVSLSQAKVISGHKALNLKGTMNREFSGSPVAKTVNFHCRGHRLDNGLLRN